MSFTAYLWTLFTSALISSTVLPGGSEALVVFGMHEFQTHLWIVVFVATAGNTLGALITYGMGRLIPNKKQEARSLELLKKIRTDNTAFFLASYRWRRLLPRRGLDEN